jgi:hypothetical protein
MVADLVYIKLFKILLTNQIFAQQRNGLCSSSDGKMFVLWS